ncbi:MAG: CxxxxCH/CxxCH domain c-type cytochrome [Myxococcales bacterium]|jgi:predicted CxxxxCH...CXXCH cytochrome family protein
MRLGSLLLLAAIAGAACAKPARDTCATYEDAVRPVLEKRCAGCHSGPSAAAGYRLDSYEGIVARRDDGTQRVQPGEQAGAFLQAARSALAAHLSAALPSDEIALLERWVAECRLAPARYEVHEPGLLNPGDAEQFHGATLRATGYETDRCAGCHGESLRGARAAGCDRCHAAGVEACSTCHGDGESAAPPRDLSGKRLSSSAGVGAHRAHLTDGPLHRAYGCPACHPMPAGARSEGHYRVGGAPDTAQADISMRAAPGQRPLYDREAGRCSGIYCHAPASDSKATNQAPRWTAGPSEASCGGCHGLPPSEPHPSEQRCERCHAIALANGRPVARLHANGRVELGAEQGCSGCHGDSLSPAPPRDLEGRTDESLPSIGAHRAHLEARNGLRGPIPCSECHAVPGQADAAGHLDDGPAEVFPDVEGVGALARRDRLEPSYDRASGRCASVYCHGSGPRLAKEQSPDFIRTPAWTGGSSQVACGSCHGVPPVEAEHQAMSDQRCHRCHGQSVDSENRIKIEVDPETGERRSRHIDGIVNVGTG